MTRISYITFTYSSTITHYVTRLVVRYVDHSTVSSAVRLERLKVDLSVQLKQCGSPGETER